jgi:hypothetical protein
MAFAPFTALLAYVVSVLYAADDGLGRTAPGDPVPAGTLPSNSGPADSTVPTWEEAPLS